MKKSYYKKNKTNQFIIGLVCSCLFLSLPLHAKKLKPKSVPDLRVLIDVSGSMKKNDPSNLRRSALKLLIGLMPEGAYADVWVFGGKTRQLIKRSKVNADWKKRAKKVITGIHSRGQFTDIEAILNRSTKQWGEKNNKFNRSVILLTDGVVDVSKIKSESVGSRERVVQEVLPALVKKGVTIHTVALSKYADHELLKGLAIGSDGWYERVDSAKELQRIFLHMFEKAAPPETLPMTDNKFQVDSSVNEITLLIFRSKDKPPAQIIQPDVVTYVEGQLPKTISWHREKNYDMVTIKSPMEGEWGIMAEIDPDNRVMVVTDLKLVTTVFLNNIIMGEQFDIGAQIFEGDEVLTRKEILDVIKMNLVQVNPDKIKKKWVLRDNGRGGDMFAGDGIFSTRLDAIALDGLHEFTIFADGQTFKRKVRQTVQVRMPVITTVQRASKEQGGGYYLEIKSREQIMKAATMKVTVTLIDPNGKWQQLKADKENNNIWVKNIAGLTEKGEYQINISIIGKSISGNPLSLRLKPIVVDGDPDMTVNDTVKPKIEEPKIVKKQKVKKVEEEKEPEKESESMSWIGFTIAAVVVNLLLVIGGIVGYRAWKKNSEMPLLDLGDEDV